MKTFTFNNKIYETDDENFLIDYEKWDENFAAGMTKELFMQGALTDAHWQIIRYIRDQFGKTSICPLVYQTCKANNLKSKTLKELFPTGYLRGACLLAGITYKDRWVNYYGESSPLSAQPGKAEMTAKVYRIDVYGFLIDPQEWDEDFAFHRAREMHVRLSEEHWRIINFLRNSYAKNKKIPNVFDCCDANQIEIYELENLFPAGYHRCLVKISGLPSVF